MHRTAAHVALERHDNLVARREHYATYFAKQPHCITVASEIEPRE